MFIKRIKKFYKILKIEIFMAFFGILIMTIILVFEQFNSTRFLDEITMFDKHIEHDQIVINCCT